MSSNNNGWNWDNFSNGVDNFGDLINTGLDIYGNISSQFSQNNNGDSFGQNNNGQPSPIYITAPSQQSNLGIDSKSLMMIGGLFIGGLVLKNIMESRSGGYYVDTIR